MRLLSTLGWTARVVVEAAKIIEPDENIVFYGYVDEIEEIRVKNALEEVKNSLGNVKEVRVDPMNFQDCLSKISNYMDDESVANITGGTKIMAFSLALRAALMDIPIIYVVTRNGKSFIKRVPVKLSASRRNFFRINGESTAMQILRLILEKPDGRIKMKELQIRLGKKYSTLSDAKRKLILANLVKEKKIGREKILIANDVAYLFGGDLL